MGCFDLRLGAENERVLDGISQFADIAGKIV